MSKISWLVNPDGTPGETWNPITGCDKISKGCQHCYAKRMSLRLAGRYGYPKDEPFRVTFHPDKLDKPLKRKKPTLYFVCSMGDMFHDDMKAQWIGPVFNISQRCPQHRFLMLTKRPANMASWALAVMTNSGILPNVGFGVTIEHANYIDRLITLQNTPAAYRFVSFEPLLSHIPLKPGDLDGINAVFVGGETGRGARPCRPDWVRSIRDACLEAGVLFHFKQWGAWVPYEPSGTPPMWDGQHGKDIDGHCFPTDMKDRFCNVIPGKWTFDLETDVVWEKATGHELDGRVYQDRVWW